MQYHEPSSKKKKGPLFWILIIAGAFIVLFLCGGIATMISQGSTPSEQKPETSTATTQAGKPTSPPATHAPTPIPTSKPTPSVVLHKQDEEVKAGKYTASIETITKQGVHHYSDLKPGQYVEAVVVDVTVPNDGSSTWVSRVMVSMTDMQGHTIDKVNTLTPLHWTPKPGAMTAIYNEFILTHGGSYILSFTGTATPTVSWKVTME